MYELEQFLLFHNSQLFVTVSEYSSIAFFFFFFPERSLDAEMQERYGTPTVTL